MGTGIGTKREVWVVEYDNKPAADSHGAVVAWNHHRTNGTRYIPEPQLVEGWPIKHGEYWLSCKAVEDTTLTRGPYVVRASEHGLWEGEEFFNRDYWEKVYVDIRFWGPLEPPRI
jgi:hypothetical protein